MPDVKQFNLQQLQYINERMAGRLPDGVDEQGAVQILTMQRNIREVLQSQANALQAAEQAKSQPKQSATADDYTPTPK